MADCRSCIHSAVCAELEEFRDPLWFINTEDAFICSYYDKEVTEHVEKVRRGKWEPIAQELNYCDTLKCSACEFVIDISEGDYKYCPNCGAKMRE